MSLTYGTNSEAEATAALEVTSQAWAEILTVTGGSIAFHKCKWQMMTWDFTNSPPTLAQHPQGNTTLKGGKGAETTIEKLYIDQPNVGL